MLKQPNIQKLYFSPKLIEDFKKIFDFPLTLIQAPMGYGKTSAAKKLLNPKDFYLFWLNIYDGSPEAFWKGLCKLFSEFNPELANDLKQLGVPTDILSIQEFIELLRKAPLKQKTLIIIDDFHLIESKAITFFFEILAQEKVTNLHIILSARFFNSFNQSELSLKGHAFMINQDSFKLDEQDIINYFALSNIQISQIEAKKLYEITEGWISGLYIQLLDCRKNKTIGLNKNIYNLLQETVYNHLSEELKEFCLAILTLGSFSYEQVGYIWQKDNFSSLLNNLIEQSAFIRYDQQTGLFYVHNLYSELLKEKSEANNFDKKKYLNRTANWFKKSDNYFAAMQIFNELQDHEKFLKTLCLEQGISSSSKKLKLLNSFFEQCPLDLRKKHISALFKYAWHLVFSGETANLSDLCNELEASLKSEKKETHLLGELELLRSLSVYNNLSKMAKHQAKAKKLLKGPINFIAKTCRWSFGSPSILYLYHSESGKLKKNVEKLLKTLKIYSSIANGHGSGGEYIMEAEWHFIQGKFDTATLTLQRAINLAKPANEVSVLLCALMLQIKIDIVDGNFDQALKRLQQMKLKLHLKKDYRYIHTLEICENTLYSLLDQANQISKEFISIEPEHLRLGFPAWGTFLILQCRYLLISSKIPELIGKATYLERISSIFPNILGLIYAHIFFAAANSILGKDENAKTSIETALTLAQPDNLIMPFVENSNYLKKLLADFNDNKQFSGFIAKILKLQNKYKKSKIKINSCHFTNTTTPLTSRELQIAKLAAAGKTNPQIGEALFISINTVKMALKKVYNKLSINNRALLKQALRKR